jgi:hypothetical protein
MLLLLDINEEQVCLMYQSTKGNDYKSISDWSILIARLLSPITIRETKVLLMLTEAEKKSKEHLG